MIAFRVSHLCLLRQQVAKDSYDLCSGKISEKDANDIRDFRFVDHHPIFSLTKFRGRGHATQVHHKGFGSFALHTHNSTMIM